MYDDGYKNIINVDVSSDDCHDSLVVVLTRSYLAEPSTPAYLLRRCRESTRQYDQRWSVRSHAMNAASGLCSLCDLRTGHEMDVRNLKFDAGTFDIAIDKGTMDAMMTAKGDVWVRLLLITIYDAIL